MCIMKIKSYSMKIQYIIGILVALLFVSCSHEEEEQKPAYGKIDVAVSVTLPQPESVNTLTRAGGLYTDTDIKNVDLLIFDKDAKFMERVKVENDWWLFPERGLISQSVWMPLRNGVSFIWLHTGGVLMALRIA